jgi:hypothetical protein
MLLLKHCTAGGKSVTSNLECAFRPDYRRIVRVLQALSRTNYRIHDVLDRQWADVQSVITTQGNILDLAYLRHRADQSRYYSKSLCIGCERYGRLRDNAVMFPHQSHG